MGNLKHIFGPGGFRPKEENFQPPDIQLKEQMLANGIEPPSYIAFDGQLRRFQVGQKKNKDGWYVIFGDEYPAGQYGNWKTGEVYTFRADIGRTLTPDEQAAIRRRIEKAQAERHAELEKQRKTAQDKAADIWYNAPEAEAHLYLQRKQIQPHGARIAPDGRLIVPLFNKDGDLQSLQYISGDGDKYYLSGGKVGECFTMIGEFSDGVVYLAEGYATAATIHEETQRPCFVSYSAANLVKVMGILRDMYGPAREIMIVADNDKSGVGERYAEQACAKHGGRYVVMPEDGDANDYKQAGGDLLELLQPKIEADWLMTFEEIIKQPKPIKWMIKNWLQADGLMMLHGRSGNGKTFIVLDMVLHIASGKKSWFGHKVRPGIVAYLAGEGHTGMRARVAAWCTHHQVNKAQFLMSKSGENLDTAEGFQKALDNLRAMPEKPDLIVIDTLHTFLSGDENHSKDAKKMLDACRTLLNEFECAVLIVHHTGQSVETQGRARGSSAWRGAMDLDISVVRADNTSPIKIQHTKTKDASPPPPMKIDLKQIDIPGWFDDDGEAVTSCVIEKSIQEENEESQSSDLDIVKQTIEQLWFESGAELVDGYPYIEKTALRDRLIEVMDKTSKTIKNHMTSQSTEKKKYWFSELESSGYLKKLQRGFLIIDPAKSSALKLAPKVKI